MHVFIDARGLENRIDGIGQFALHILARLPLHTRAHFSVLVRDDLHYDLPSAPHVAYLPTTIRRFTFGEAKGIGSLVFAVKPDLYFNLSSYLLNGIGCKRYMMLYDLLSTHFKGHFRGMGLVKGFLARKYFRHRLKKSVEKADGIFTISNYSREKICSQYKIDKSRIGVVYGGVDTQYDAHSDERRKQDFLSRHSLPKKFFLHVGNLKPYKNVAGILKAYSSFIKKHPESEIDFVFTGGPGRGYNETLDLIASLNLKQSVKIMGYFNGEEMPLLYSASLGLFFPSLEEGFGLPVLEAMCCKTPVVTSQGTATEEIAGGHAFLVDPRSHNSLLDGLEHLAFSEKNADAIDKAYSHAKEFSWDKTADTIISALLEK